MRKMRNMIMAAAMAGMLGMSSLLTGCGFGIPGIHTDGMDSSKKNPQSVSLVLGHHRFFPRIILNREEIESLIYDACYTYGSVSAVTVDGAPFVSCNFEINKPDKRIDTHQSTRGENDKSMIIFESGLSTASFLDFSAQNIIDEPADSIVSQLEELHAIPDLEGIDVTWFGIGQTCGEQTDLTPDYKYRLQNIWQAILEKGGGQTVLYIKLNSVYAKGHFIFYLGGCSFLFLSE